MTHPMIALPLFGVGMTEWVIIGAAILLFFGAAKLPKLGRGLGEGIRNFKKGIKGELDEDGNPIVQTDSEQPTTAKPNNTSDSEDKLEEGAQKDSSSSDNASK